VPQDNFFFEPQQYLTFPQQISVPRSTFCDAVYINPGPGYLYSAEILCDSDVDAEALAGYQYWDNDGPVSDLHLGLKEGPLDAINFNVTRGTQSQSYYTQMRVQMPSHIPDRTGKRTNGTYRYVKWNQAMSFAIAGTWYSDLMTGVYNILNTLVESIHFQTAAITPGQSHYIFAIQRPRLFEFPGIKCVRTRMIKSPNDASTGAGIPPHYKGGYITFGYR